jgi:hypothetical protein
MFANRIRFGLALVALVLAAGMTQAQDEPAKTLAGTTWTGSENLQGFAKLTFQFPGGNKVIMIDAQGKTEGVFKLTDDQVVLTFAGGEVAYVGKIEGNVLEGTATSKNIKNNKSWSWQVTLAEQPQQPNNPAAQKPAGSGPGPKTPPPAGPPSAEKLAERLKKLGLDVKIITPDIGPAYCIVIFKDKDDWTYHIETKFHEESLWLTATLDQLPGGRVVDTEKLMRLLEANDRMAPCFFFFRAADRRLCMKLEVMKLGNDQALAGNFNCLLRNVRMNYDLWNTANWAKE